MLRVAMLVCFAAFAGFIIWLSQVNETKSRDFEVFVRTGQSPSAGGGGIAVPFEIVLWNRTEYGVSEVNLASIVFYQVNWPNMLLPGSNKQRLLNSPQYIGFIEIQYQDFGPRSKLVTRTGLETLSVSQSSPLTEFSDHFLTAYREGFSNPFIDVGALTCVTVKNSETGLYSQFQVSSVWSSMVERMRTDDPKLLRWFLSETLGVSDGEASYMARSPRVAHRSYFDENATVAGRKTPPEPHGCFNGTALNVIDLVQGHPR